ncbi:hypothetical protein B0J13DRAFT_658600 [Dactylonectria estremocensis]|uniref:Uncharacterized protein n=1 Tax=Dactylonectria estremocensis TaxID=1079267 RepID=A0A9P9F4U4_9HYPO|nr:hypothetical protein B0J13DRAFT_658600 [Dactylonectria estremocensis]
MRASHQHQSSIILSISCAQFQLSQGLLFLLSKHFYQSCPNSLSLEKMRLAQVFAFAAVVASTVSAQTPSYATPYTTTITTAFSEDVTRTTTVYGSYTFYCPEPTTFIHKNATYTVSKPTYLTITNCPCTVTYTTPLYPVTTSYSTLTTDGRTPTIIYQPTNPPTKAPIGTATTITNTIPVEPTKTEPHAVPTAGAAKKAGTGFGALAIAGAAVMIM